VDFSDLGILNSRAKAKPLQNCSFGQPIAEPYLMEKPGAELLAPMIGLPMKYGFEFGLRNLRSST
jgi:hypothetical protein